MKFVTAKDLLPKLITRWNHQHPKENETAKILLQLQISGKLTNETAAQAIGNKAWTYLTCQACEESVLEAIHVCNDPEGGSINLCYDCIAAAKTLADRHEFGAGY